MKEKTVKNYDRLGSYDGYIVNRPRCSGCVAMLWAVIGMCLTAFFCLAPIAWYIEKTWK